MGPAPVMRGLQDRDRLLLRDGKGEERVGLGEDFRLQLRRDSVALQEEEPRPSRCGAEIGDEALRVRALGEPGEIKHGDHAAASSWRVSGAFPISRSIFAATRPRCLARLSAVELSIR
jgi:hypothetical protein